MERLEPILKQKFWILLGVGLIMTFTGWWMATGSLAATIATRRTEIENAEKKVPSGQIPNNDWSSKLAAVNAEQERAVKSTARILWERQRARMTWPATVDEFAFKNGYRGEIAIEGRENYRTAYGDDVRRVWESVLPFNRYDGTGLVDFTPEKMPMRQWGALAPSSAEMWDAQEDLWLLEGLLQAIVEVNGGPTSTRQDACLHVIERLSLHGGQPAGQRGIAAAAPTSPGGQSEGMTSGAFGSSSFGSGGGGGIGGDRTGTTAAVPADFDFKEEFGDDGSGSGGGQGGGGTGLASSGSAFGGGGTADQGGAAAVKGRRYLDDEDALPYKTRGFYMTVIMDHRKIPNLISQLSASDKSAWPIEILRVQVVRLHDDDADGKSPSPGINLSSGSTGGGGPASTFSGSGGDSGSPFSGAFGNQDQTLGFSPLGNSSGNQTGTASAQSLAAIAALDNALSDPYMARVALCGIITLYKEVKPEEVPANPPTGTPTPSAPLTESTTGGQSTQPAPTEGAPPTAEGTAPVEAKQPESTENTPAAKSEASPSQPETPAKDGGSSSNSIESKSPGSQ